MTKSTIPVAVSFFIGYEESVVVFFEVFFSRLATSKFWKNCKTDRDFVTYSGGNDVCCLTLSVPTLGKLKNGHDYVRAKAGHDVNRVEDLWNASLKIC